MKKLLSLCIMILLALALTAQIKINPFKPIPSPYKLGVKKLGLKLNGLDSVVIVPLLGTLRFTGSIAGYMYPANQLVTGLGYGYQNLKWNNSTQKWEVLYSINGMLFTGGGVDSTSLLNKGFSLKNISLGITIGLFNQKISFGPAYNFGLKKMQIVTSFGIPFN